MDADELDIDLLQHLSELLEIRRKVETGEIGEDQLLVTREKFLADVDQVVEDCNKIWKSEAEYKGCIH